MQIYTTKDGEKQGPFTIYRIKEMIDADDLSPDELGWHEGLEKWCALKDIPVIASTLKSLEKKPPQADELSEGEQDLEKGNKISLPLPSSSPSEKTNPPLYSSQNVRPFIRFWARMFDYLLLNLLVWFVFAPPQIPTLPSDPTDLLEFLRNLNGMIPQEEQIRIAMIQGGALFVWNFIEALLISSFGTTPGKMLFNISVRRKNGKQLNYSEAIGRSLLVWLLGIGLGITILQFLAMSFSLFYLLNKGETLWDRRLQTQIHHQPLSPQKIVFAIGSFLILLSLQSMSFS